METEDQARQPFRQSPTVAENDKDNADGLGIIDETVTVGSSLPDR
jgi:hypothetical protein